MKNHYLTLAASVITTLAATQTVQAQIAEETLASPHLVKQVHFTQEPVRKKVITSSPRKEATTNNFDGRTFFGAMVYSDSWANMSITETPSGLYEFTLNGSTIESEVKYSQFYYNFMSASYGRDHYYGIRPINMLGALNGVYYHEFNLDNFTETRELSVEQFGYDDLAAAMCYDYTNDRIYAVQYNDDLTGLYWSTFDKSTMTFDIISAWSGRFNVLTLSSTPDGKMYCIGTDGDFYEINKSNGRTSFIGSTGVNALSYSQSMYYDGVSGTFIWNAITPDGSELYSVDITNGQANYITTFSDGEQIVGTYTTENQAPAKAPASITDLNLNFTSSGSLSATIDFTMPATTYDGSLLTDNPHVDIWLDGELISSQSRPASQKVSIPVTLTNDNHYIAITLSNEYGFGPYNNTLRYAGFDYPEAVRNLQFTIENNTCKLSWDSPAGGINKGYIDNDMLYYQIYRNPGNVLVADQYKSTTFTEEVPEEMQAYYYTIIPFNGPNKQGKAAQTQEIIGGASYATPYQHTFDTPESVDIFTILNLNGDNNMWRYNSSSNEISIFSPYETEQANDWLISPRIRLESGKLYRFMANLRTLGQPYSEQVKIAIGTSIDETSIDNFTVIADWSDLRIADFEDTYVDFTVLADGDYYIALGYLSQKSVGSVLRLRSIGVNEVGNLTAPGEIENLTITPDPSETLSTTITFDTPSKNIAGEDLTSLTAIHIYRNSDMETPVHTFTAPSIGTNLTWTDNKVPYVGYNTYTIIPENNSGSGYPSTISAFIGIYSAPYLETFTDPTAAKLYTCRYQGITDPDNTLSFGIDYTGMLSLSHYSSQEVETAIYSPVMKFDTNAVYELSYNLSNSDYNEKSVYQTRLTSQTELGHSISMIGEMPKSYYEDDPVTHEVVVKEGGRYYIEWYAHILEANTYICYGLNNISLKYITSALSPNQITDFNATPDPQGNLQATLTFAAPAIDYADRELSEISKIEIFRGTSAIPVKIIEDPQPGQTITWTDEQPMDGNNVYTIVPFNQNGKGKAYTDSVYVGYDIPYSVETLTITPDNTNQIPTLTWQAPKKGINGGIIDMNSLTYTVCSYNINASGEQEYTVLAENIKEQQYTVDRKATDTQEVCYYAVMPVTNQGEGYPIISYSLLGKPYSIPFKESFAGAVNETNPWTQIDNVPYMTSWGYTTGSSMETYGVQPQDGDDGAAYFFNGNYSESYKGAKFVTPKISTNGENATLSFWAYQGLSCIYTQKPTLTVYITTNEKDFIKLGETIIMSEGEPGWVNYTYDLSEYKNAPCFSIIFEAYSSGQSDIIYIDNITINQNPTGLQPENTDDDIRVEGTTGGIITYGAQNKTINVYTVNGINIDNYISEDCFRPIPAGIYIIRIEEKIFKVIVR